MHSDLQFDLNDYLSKNIKIINHCISQNINIFPKRASRPFLSSLKSSIFRFIIGLINFDYYDDFNGQPKLLIKQDFLELKEVSSKHPFSLITAKRTSNISRIWTCKLAENIFVKLNKIFDSKETKKLFSNIVGIDLTNLRTRSELCNDKKGSWLENHVDDKDKLFVMQIYLTNLIKSTIIDNTQTIARENSGWFFANTGKEYHRLLPLEENRTSIIIHYVKNWNKVDTLI